MLSVLTITLPVFLIIGLGFCAVRFGLMAKDSMRTLGVFVLSFALPALIVKSLAERSIAGAASASYLAAYGGGSLIAYFLLFAVARWQGKPVTAAALHALGSSSSNSAFIGYPLVSLALGPVAAVAMTLNIIIESMVMMTLAMVLAEAGSSGGGTEAGAGGAKGSGVRKVLHAIYGAVLRLVKHPIIISLCAGATLSLSGLQLPEPVFRALGLLAGAAPPVALFVIGGTLANLPLRGLLGDAAQIASAKLTIHPAAVFACLQLVPPLTPELTKAAILFAAMPMASVYPLLAQPYGRGEEGAAALALATAASFVTISVLLRMLQSV